MEFYVILKIVFMTCCVVVFAGTTDRPKNMSEEMYCLGCQVTVKELDSMLSRKLTRGMGETVTRALKRVCDKHNFDKYDVDAKRVLEVCEHIKNDEGLEAFLITEYGRKHATGKYTQTYLDISQTICSTVIKACRQAGTLEINDEDGGIIYDPVIKDFFVKEGKKVRTPKPIQEKIPDPNQTADRADDVKPREERKMNVEQAREVNIDSHDEL
ncbi:uncharacterized protein LOC132746288 [Ruditapes philippinarum]|uniref:uncharacterized protein LOC132746288 n=1 Tax=Ruditapes philippinarum TaxID=129788 RepID=UPI00295ABD19|nr:uncharacterized protein LOC132746288 [Ruditapes philippinarum]